MKLLHKILMNVLIIIDVFIIEFVLAIYQYSKL